MCYIKTSAFKSKIWHKYTQNCVKLLKIIRKLKKEQNGKIGQKLGLTRAPTCLNFYLFIYLFLFFFWILLLMYNMLFCHLVCKTTYRLPVAEIEDPLQNDLSLVIVFLTQQVRGSTRGRLIWPAGKWRFQPPYSAI